MTLPEARDAMIELARHLPPHQAWQLRFLITQGLYRRKPVRRAPPRPEPRITRTQVERFFRAHPTANFQQAAEHFGTNMRKISYVYRGRRT